MLKKDLFCDLAMEFVLTRKNEELGDLSVSRIARELHVSPSYLARVFKEERNFSLKEYLQREKMLRSAALLVREPQLTLRELARQIGFLDSGYFGFLFKKYFGISPGRYRDVKKMLLHPEKHEPFLPKKKGCKPSTDKLVDNSVKSCRPESLL